MVYWIKDIIAKNKEISLYGEYKINQEDCRMVVTISPNGKNPVYSVDLTPLNTDTCDNKVVTQEIRDSITDNIGHILDEAVVIIYQVKNKRTIIIEDSTGIHGTDIENIQGRYLITDIDNYYSKAYMNQVCSLKGTKKFCNVNTFFTRISKKENRYSLEEALDYLRAHPEEFMMKERDKSETEDPIISVSLPDITRKAGNDDKNTFDFVAVELLLRHDLNIKDMKAYVKKNLQILNKRALDKIAENRKYQSFGVPVEYLKLYSIGTHMKTEVRMMYELKKVRR